jgi:hypothetical protein
VIVTAKVFAAKKMERNKAIQRIFFIASVLSLIVQSGAE